MSTNVHVGYLDGPPFVHVDMIFLLNSSNMHKIVLFKQKTLLSIMLESVYCLVWTITFFLLRGVKQGTCQ